MSTLKAEIENYGVIGGTSVSKNLLELSRFAKNQKQVRRPSNLAVVGRYIFSDEIFKALDEIGPGKGGEIQLTDAIAVLLKEKKNFMGYI